MTEDQNETNAKRVIEFEKFLSDLDDESDRGLVLSAFSMLELCVERALSARFPNSTAKKRLFRNDGPLGSFSARSDLCLCLKLIDNFEHTALTLTSKIRNDFAHRLLVNFTDQAVKDRCEQLATWTLSEDNSLSQKILNKGPRACFTVSMFVLVYMLKERDTLVANTGKDFDIDFGSLHREFANLIEESENDA